VERSKSAGICKTVADQREDAMRALLLWGVGVPIPIIILLFLFHVL
jgi:hypothetical protein